MNAKKSRENAVVQIENKNALESLLRHFSAPLLGLEPRTP